MKNSALNLLAAGIVSAGIAIFSSGCCSTCCGDSCAAEPKSCECAKAPEACTCASKCACANCGCVYGNWGINLPYPEMNAAHLILDKGKDGKASALLLWRWGSPTPAEVTAIDAKSFTIQRPFSKPKGKENDKAAWRALRITATVNGNILVGKFCTVDGNGKAVDKPDNIAGQRNPPVGPAPDFSDAIYGKPVDMHNMAAYYGRVTPKVAAEKPANEWQTVDVTLYKRHLTVVLNGVTIIEKAPVVGVTGGAMTSNEFVPGPLYIQGDHSDADFRNMVLTPILK